MSAVVVPFPAIVWSGGWLPLQAMTLDSGSPLAHYSHVDADADDVRQTLAGDGNSADAFRRIVQRNQIFLARRMRRFAQGPAAVEELVQDIFVQAYFSLRTYSGKVPFEHWLGKIATRVGYQSWKRHRRSSAAALPDDLAARQSVSGADTEKLHLLLGRLPPRDRLVLTLLHLEDRSVAEAADLCGWSKAMVKVQAFRARAKLKKLFTSQVPS